MSNDKNFFCSNLSVSKNEEIFGTASQCSAFLLVRHPCPFPEKIVDAFLPEKWMHYLVSFAKVRKIKLLLTRDNSFEPIPEIIYVDHFQHRYKRFHLSLDAPEIFDLARGLDSEDIPWLTDPFFLVCTNGKKDKCCSLKGFPVYTKMEETKRYPVFQCSHVGGDRFAANVLMMPFGIYYGRVEANKVETIYAALEKNEISPLFFRGCSTLNFLKQAIDFYLRRFLNYYKIESNLMITGFRHVGSEINAFGIYNSHYFEIELNEYSDSYNNYLTCKSANKESSKKYSLVNIHVDTDGSHQ